MVKNMEIGKKIEIGLLIIYSIYLSFMAFVSFKLNWFTTNEFIIYGLLIPILTLGCIWVLKKFINGKKSQIEEDPLKKVMKLNATTVEPWIINYMQDHYSDTVGIVKKRLKKVGKEERLTPIMYINAHGKTTFRNWHIFINLYNPEEEITIEYGDMIEEKIKERMDDLAEFQAPYEDEQVIVRNNMDGSERITSRRRMMKEDIIVNPSEEE